MPVFHERLLKVAACYHDGSRDEHAYGEYVQHFSPRRQRVSDFILGFLVDWGSLARIFPKEGLSGLKAELDQWFAEHEGVISQLSTELLWRADLGTIGYDICELFDTLRRVQQPVIRGRKRTFGPTAAGKTLHLLLPKLCVIWDEETVRKNVGLDGDAWSYLRYLRAQKAILGKAMQAVSEQNQCNAEAAVQWIEQTHRLGHEKVARLSFDEPVTKILDEAMYDSVLDRKSVV